jgi:hypothetical protein
VPDFIGIILIALIVIVNAFIFSTSKYNNIKTFMTLLLLTLHCGEHLIALSILSRVVGVLASNCKSLEVGTTDER